MSGNALVRRSGASKLRQTYVGIRTCPPFPFGHPAAARRTACCCIEAVALLSRQYRWGWGEYVRRPTSYWGFRSYLPHIRIIISVPSSTNPWKFAGFILFQFIYMYIYTHTHTHTYVYIYIYIYIHTDVYIMYVSVCVCMCVCVCVFYVYDVHDTRKCISKNITFLLQLIYLLTFGT
jgi:hypothetical protein